MNEKGYISVLGRTLAIPIEQMDCPGVFLGMCGCLPISQRICDTCRQQATLMVDVAVVEVSNPIDREGRT